MVDFDKFEKNVKNKYGNQEFPFDEQNWEKAAQLIDASRKGKNRGGIILWSTAALLVTSGLVYYFGFSDSSSALKDNNLAIHQNVNATNETSNNNTLVSDNNSVTESSSTTENTSSENNSNPLNDATVAENNSNSTSTEVKTTSETKKVSDNSTVTDTKAAASSGNKTSHSTSNETKAESKTSTPVSSDNNVSGSTTNNTSSTLANTKKSTPVKTNTKTSTTPPVLSNNNNVAQTTNKPVASNPTTTEPGNTNKLGDVKNETDNNTTATVPVKNNGTVVDSNSNVVTATVKPTESAIADSVPKISKGRADSLAAMAPKGDGVSYATNVKEKHNAKNFLYMEAGTTYLLGWNAGSQAEADGFNLLAGFNFQHYFTGSIAAQIGVQYSTIGNLSNTTHTISTVNYDLGMEQDVTSIRYQRLHYIVAPLKVTFNAGDKNIIGVGANIGYLLNSESKKESYKTNSHDPNAPKNEFKSSKESGYVEGFNPFDIQVGVSYRRRIYKGFSANAEFFYGLTDTKDNGFFKSNNFDRNTGFKVSLCYDLFKK